MDLNSIEGTINRTTATFNDKITEMHNLFNEKLNIQKGYFHRNVQQVELLLSRFRLKHLHKYISSSDIYAFKEQKQIKDATLRDLSLNLQKTTLCLMLGSSPAYDLNIDAQAIYSDYLESQIKEVTNTMKSLYKDELNYFKEDFKVIFGKCISELQNIVKDNNIQLFDVKNFEISLKNKIEYYQRVLNDLMTKESKMQIFINKAVCDIKLIPTKMQYPAELESYVSKVVDKAVSVVYTQYFKNGDKFKTAEDYINSSVEAIKKDIGLLNGVITEYSETCLSINKIYSEFCTEIYALQVLDVKLVFIKKCEYIKESQLEIVSNGFNPSPKEFSNLIEEFKNKFKEIAEESDVIISDKQNIDLLLQDASGWDIAYLKYSYNEMATPLYNLIYNKENVIKVEQIQQLKSIHFHHIMRLLVVNAEYSTDNITTLEEVIAKSDKVLFCIYISR